MTFGRDNPMVVKMVRIGLLAAVLGVVVVPSWAAAGSDKSDAFEDIWTEDLERESGRAELSKERLDQIIKYASQGKADEEKRLRKLYTDDQPKFWGQVREFFQRSRPSGRGPGPNGQGPRGGGRWRERLQKQHDELLALIKEHRPELARKLADLRESERESDRDKYFREFSAQRRIWGPVLDARKRGNKELAALLIKDIDLVEDRDALLREIHCGPDKKRLPKLMAQLREVIGKRFDLILKKKKLQYEALRRRLRRLQEELEGKQQELENLTGSKKQAIIIRVNKLVPREKDN